MHLQEDMIRLVLQFSAIRGFKCLSLEKFSLLTSLVCRNIGLSMHLQIQSTILFVYLFGSEQLDFWIISKLYILAKTLLRPLKLNVKYTTAKDLYD